jgi:AcrR family transcriptional regulator
MYVHRMSPRRYTLKQRAESQAQTRRRIVEAIVALHREVGPARTTISAIAERAGVERLTVYRHFADEGEMFAACSAHFRAEVPGPDPAAWAALHDPAERLRGVLVAQYDYFRRGGDMLVHVARDAPELPALAAVLAPQRAAVARLRDDLVDRWGVRDDARARLAAAIGHALRLDTWRSLTRDGGLDDATAADLMVTLAVAAGGAPGAG